eukprot:768066-Hanusia_phi.AAC.12
MYYYSTKKGLGELRKVEAANAPILDLDYRQRTPGRQTHNHGRGRALRESGRVASSLCEEGRKAQASVTVLCASSRPWPRRD